MASNVIPFVARPVNPALPEHCSEFEEARHMVACLRTQRDACTPDTRQHKVEQIKLDWWMDELLRVSDAADSNIIPLRRAAQ